MNVTITYLQTNKVVTHLNVAEVEVRSGDCCVCLIFTNGAFILFDLNQYKVELKVTPVK